MTDHARLFDTAWGQLLARVTHRRTIDCHALELNMWFEEFDGEITCISFAGDPWQRLADLDQETAEREATKLAESAALIAGEPDHHGEAPDAA